MVASGGTVSESGGRASAGGSNASGGMAPGGSGGAAGNAGAGGSRDDGGTPDGGRLACKNPVPRLGPDGKPTGFVDCDGTLTHRPQKITCASTLPRQTPCVAPDGTDTCSLDSDCTTSPNGYCSIISRSVGPTVGPACVCNYGCRNDEDCGANGICGCGDPVGECATTANCKTDADCGEGLLCILTRDEGCFYTFACQTPKDTCASQADCGTSWCAFVTDHHECVSPKPCSTGRPFLVEGEARVAHLSTDAAWAFGQAPDVTRLGVAERAVLSAYYADVALMEHASIAAFARFALELLSLGAPPELLAETHAAMADETIHARTAFALATAYAGHPVGPGRLAVERSLSDRTALDVARTAILEGCIGETVAALEAAEALAHATEPAVCAALKRVVLDETRHAELAFRFVQWALESGPRELRAATSTELLTLVGDEIRLAKEIECDGLEPSSVLSEHGLLGRATRAKIRQQALSEVVLPCVAAMVKRAAPYRNATLTPTAARPET